MQTQLAVSYLRLYYSSSHHTCRHSQQYPTRDFITHLLITHVDTASSILLGTLLLIFSSHMQTQLAVSYQRLYYSSSHHTCRHSQQYPTWDFITHLLITHVDTASSILLETLLLIFSSHMQTQLAVSYLGLYYSSSHHTCRHSQQYPTRDFITHLLITHVDTASSILLGTLLLIFSSHMQTQLAVSYLFITHLLICRHSQQYPTYFITHLLITHVDTASSILLETLLLIFSSHMQTQLAVSYLGHYYSSSHHTCRHSQQYPTWDFITHLLITHVDTASSILLETLLLIFTSHMQTQLAVSYLGIYYSSSHHTCRHSQQYPTRDFITHLLITHVDTASSILLGTLLLIFSSHMQTQLAVSYQRLYYSSSHHTCRHSQQYPTWEFITHLLITHVDTASSILLETLLLIFSSHMQTQLAVSYLRLYYSSSHHTCRHSQQYPTRDFITHLLITHVDTASSILLDFITHLLITHVDTASSILLEALLLIFSSHMQTQLAVSYLGLYYSSSHHTCRHSQQYPTWDFITHLLITHIDTASSILLGNLLLIFSSHMQTQLAVSYQRLYYSSSHHTCRHSQQYPTWDFITHLLITHVDTASSILLETLLLIFTSHMQTQLAVSYQGLYYSSSHHTCRHSQQYPTRDFITHLLITHVDTASSILLGTLLLIFSSHMQTQLAVSYQRLYYSSSHHTCRHSQQYPTWDIITHLLITHVDTASSILLGTLLLIFSSHMQTQLAVSYQRLYYSSSHHTCRHSQQYPTWEFITHLLITHVDTASSILLGTLLLIFSSHMQTQLAVSYLGLYYSSSHHTCRHSQQYPTRDFITHLLITHVDTASSILLETLLLIFSSHMQTQLAVSYQRLYYSSSHHTCRHSQQYPT